MTEKERSPRQTIQEKLDKVINVSGRTQRRNLKTVNPKYLPRGREPEPTEVAEDLFVQLVDLISRYSWTRRSHRSEVHLATSLRIATTLTEIFEYDQASSESIGSLLGYISKRNNRLGENVARIMQAAFDQSRFTKKPRN